MIFNNFIIISYLSSHLTTLSFCSWSGGRSWRGRCWDSWRKRHRRSSIVRSGHDARHIKLRLKSGNVRHWGRRKIRSSHIRSGYVILRHWLLLDRIELIEDLSLNLRLDGGRGGLCHIGKEHISLLISKGLARVISIFRRIFSVMLCLWNAGKFGCNEFIDFILNIISNRWDKRIFVGFSKWNFLTDLFDICIQDQSLTW